MNGLKTVSTGDDLYGGDLAALAKIMVGVIDLTESINTTNRSDAVRINKVSPRLSDDSFIENGGSGYDHDDNDDEIVNGDDGGRSLEADDDLLCDDYADNGVVSDDNCSNVVVTKKSID